MIILISSCAIISVLFIATNVLVFFACFSLLFFLSAFHDPLCLFLNKYSCINSIFPISYNFLIFSFISFLLQDIFLFYSSFMATFLIQIFNWLILICLVQLHINFWGITLPLYIMWYAFAILQFRFGFFFNLGNVWSIFCQIIFAKPFIIVKENFYIEV